MLRCRTAALGGYLKQCDACGQWEAAYNACKNRHCPNCGHFEKAQWLEKQKPFSSLPLLPGRLHY
ncbi:MAG: transposase zinc-binding domain-containing protein [Chloroflexi bacterium]|nr:transposase zinc-binding domain-containing protein [Chloroflexota bacterium]